MDDPTKPFDFMVKLLVDSTTAQKSGVSEIVQCVQVSDYGRKMIAIGKKIGKLPACIQYLTKEGYDQHDRIAGFDMKKPHVSKMRLEKNYNNLLKLCDTLTQMFVDQVTGPIYDFDYCGIVVDEKWDVYVYPILN